MTFRQWIESQEHLLPVSSWHGKSPKIVAKYNAAPYVFNRQTYEIFIGDNENEHFEFPSRGDKEELYGGYIMPQSSRIDFYSGTFPDIPTQYRDQIKKSISKWLGINLIGITNHRPWNPYKTRYFENEQHLLPVKSIYGINPAYMLLQKYAPYTFNLNTQEIAIGNQDDFHFIICPRNREDYAGGSIYIRDGKIGFSSGDLQNIPPEYRKDVMRSISSWLKIPLVPMKAYSL